MTDTPRRTFVEKLDKEHPAFRRQLGARPTIVGWSHNPWQDASTPDAQATHIARKYLVLLTKAMQDLGYLPFTGAEVNAPLIGNHRNSVYALDGHIKQLYKGMQKAARQNRIDFLNKYKKPWDAKADETLETPWINATTSIDTPLHGRIYVDGNELEIATPAQSPAATASRVNNIKRWLFESTYDYGMEYSRSPEGQSQPDAPIPASIMAQLIQAESAPYNILFADSDRPTGEHYSFSLIRHTLDSNMHYGNAKRDIDVFGAANLLNNRGWDNLFRQGFEQYLPHDTLLAYGHPQLWQRFATKDDRPVKHMIRRHIPYNTGNTVNTQESPAENDAETRLEIRSFNDASSNVTLSSLAILATAYALVKTIHAEPELRRQRTGTLPMLPSERQQVFQSMQKRCPGTSQAPTSLAEGKKRFLNQSLTVSMMREWVGEHVPDPARRTALYEEIETFRRAVIERAECIERSYAPTASR